VKTKKEEALEAWEAILAGLVMTKEADFQDVEERMPKVPKPHVQLIQLAIKGAGYATTDLNPDGDWGDQSFASLGNLHTAAHS